jgi:hypothetical protein
MGAHCPEDLRSLPVFPPMPALTPADTLVDRPLQWRRVDEVGEGLRRSVFGSHSIYYLIDADEIAIVRSLGYQELGSSFRKAKK